MSVKCLADVKIRIVISRRGGQALISYHTRILAWSDPTHAISGLVGVSLAERVLKRTNERRREAFLEKEIRPRVENHLCHWLVLDFRK